MIAERALLPSAGRRVRAAVVLAAGLSLLAGCDNWLTKPSRYNSIEVSIASRNGDPVRGAEVQLYTGQRAMGYGTTDAEGRFTFQRVPDGLYGIVAIPPQGYALLESLVQSPATNVVPRLPVAGDTVPPIRFTFLQRGPGQLAVRVVDTDGRPLPDLVVSLYDPGAVIGGATTDAEGRAVFDDVPFGVYGVSFARPVPFRDFRTLGDSAFAFRDDLIVDAGSRDSAVFVLTRCIGSVRVRAIDQAGAAVRGATAIVYTSSKELAGGQTGADGRIGFGDIPCVSQIGVRITAPAGYAVDDGRGSSFVDGVVLSLGQVFDVTFRLRAAP